MPALEHRFPGPLLSGWGVTSPCPGVRGGGTAVSPEKPDSVPMAAPLSQMWASGDPLPLLPGGGQGPTSGPP